MAGIIDYIRWRGDLDFDTSPFNPVDNLIFSELSYMSFSPLIQDQGKMTLKALAQLYQGQHKGDLGLLLTGDFDLLLSLMAQSKRYGSLLIHQCLEIMDPAIEVQFAAMTIELNPSTAYIAYRGTDDTIIGWKEDFKMSFLDVVPAQLEALNYLEDLMSDPPYDHLYLGGHSKGGNLAVYAAVHAKKCLQDRITCVYNNDGPGFKQSLLETMDFTSVSHKIITFVPQSSIIGMIMEHEESYQVVQSTQKGALQHDGFSWSVMGTDFEYLTEVDDDCIMVDMTLKKVLEAMSLDQREDFTNSLFDIISVNQSRTLMDIRKEGLKSLYLMSKNYNHLDKETKKAIHTTVSLFFGEGFRSFLEVKNADQWEHKLANWRRDVRKKLGISATSKRSHADGPL